MMDSVLKIKQMKRVICASVSKVLLETDVTVSAGGSYLLGSESYAKQGRREGGAGGAKYLGPGLVWGARNLDKTPGYCAIVKRVGGP